MFVDVCIPENNEEEFIKVAERIGTGGLLFLYSKTIPSKTYDSRIKVWTGSLGNAKGRIVFGEGSRKNVEDKSTRFLYGFETLEEKDSLHYRKSGINQVIAKLIKSKNKVIVLDFEKILQARRPQRELGRMISNLEMITKYKLDFIICSFATKPFMLKPGSEFESLLRSLGFQAAAKKGVSMLGEYLSENSNL